MKKLYLVRHGETVFNVKYLVQGRCDSPLTEKGHLQAKAAGKIFEENHITFDHAYCSMLGRCEQTIREITDMPYVRNPALNERSYGSMEGESRKIAENFTYQQRSTLYEMCGGETSEAVIQRMNTFLHGIMDQKDHQSVLCVSHGAAIGYFLFDIDKNTTIHQLENCHILEFDYDGEFHLVKDYIPQI